MIIRVILSLALLSYLAVPICNANVVGDIDYDDQITLVEAIGALRVVAGIDEAAQRKDELFSGDYWIGEYGIERGMHGTEFGELTSSGFGFGLVEELADSDGSIDKSWALYEVALDGSFEASGNKLGVISADGSLLVAMEHDPDDNNLLLHLGMSKADGASVGLLNGTYYLNSIGVDHDLNDPDHWTQVLEIISDGTGNLNWNVLGNSRGDTGSGSGTYTINSDGRLSLGTGGNAVISSDGNVFMGVDTDPSDDNLSIDVAVKASTSADNSLLSGTYIMCEIGVDPNHWVGRLKVTSDGAGNISYEEIDNSNGSTGTGSTTYSIAPNGRITVNGAETGVVSPDGQVFTFVDLSTSVMSLQVGIKMSDLP